MDALAKDVGDDGPIVTDPGKLPEWELLAHREAQRGRHAWTAQRDRPAGPEAPPFIQYLGRVRYGLHRLDAAEQGGDLRQRMHRLLQQDVGRRGEHPMAELPRRELAQRNAVNAVYKAQAAPPGIGHRPT